jgi:predicted alpha/beta-fold hydrolase
MRPQKIISSLLFILILGILVYITMPSFLADSLIKPKRQPIIKTPQDYGMKYESIEFKSTDGVKLKGWYIPGASEKLIIMTHPMIFTKYGFSAKDQGLFKVTDLDVEFMKTAGALNGAGYSVLTFDFRNHGESDAANNGYSAVGLFEWQDLAGALDYIAERNDLKNKKIGFVSHCMGANTTIIAMSKAKDKFKNVRCLIAVQPVSADVFTKCIIKDKYPLFSLFYADINKKAKEFTGCSLEEMSPKTFVKDITVPVLYVQVKADPWTTHEDIEGFYQSTPSEKMLLWIEGKERFEGYNYFGDHPEEMLNFLKKYM